MHEFNWMNLNGGRMKELGGYVEKCVRLLSGIFGILSADQ
jgi:hypothetical protein